MTLRGSQLNVKKRILTDANKLRYSRQLIYPDFHKKGQKKLKESEVVVVGVGGLGCVASICLACAGIGHITIVDHDIVEFSNLNRQILYSEDDIGKEKPFLAAQRLIQMNPSIEVSPLFKRVTKDNVRNIIKGSHAVVDGLDNLESKLILNWACVSQGIPLIHGGVHGLLGEITTIIPGKTPCLACLFSDSVKKANEIPVFGATTALIASLQVMEVIKLLVGFGELLTSKMLYVQGATMKFTFLDLIRKPDCAVCGGTECEHHSSDSSYSI